jgi:hypothetical protein
MFLLRARRPQRYGKWIDRMLAPDGDDVEQDPGIVLDGGLTGIEFGVRDASAEDEEDWLGDDGSEQP